MAVAFDTLKFVEKITEAGMPKEQAVGLCMAMKDAFEEFYYYAKHKRKMERVSD